MADKPVDEIVNLDAILDALPGSPTSSDVYEATLPFPARDVAASAAQRALNGGGGGGTPDLAAVLAEGAAAGGAAITGLADPSGDQDAATKKYVDDNSGGGSSLVQTVVDEILFSDFVASEAEAPSWPGVAPYRTITADQVVFACWIIVMEAFNDSGGANEIQVTDDPESASIQMSNAPNPTVLGVNGGTVWKYTGVSGASTATVGCIAPYRPKASITPIVALGAFAGDGTTGRALIFTTLYTPPS